MKTKKSNPSFKKRIVRKFGDSSILHGAFNTKFWKWFFFNFNLALWGLIKDFLRFQTAVLAFQQNAVLRFRFGYKSTGLLLATFAVSQLIAVNSVHIWVVFRPFFMLINPFLPIWCDQETLIKWLTVDIRSSLLLYYIGFLAFMSCIHIITIWTKFGNSDGSKRGDSILYLLISKICKCDEYYICGILEPALAALVALYVWDDLGDHVFAFSLWLSAGAVALQQAVDFAYHSHNESITKA